jgi:hypothetical protein
MFKNGNIQVQNNTKTLSVRSFYVVLEPMKRIECNYDFPEIKYYNIQTKTVLI